MLSSITSPIQRECLVLCNVTLMGDAYTERVLGLLREKVSDLDLDEGLATFVNPHSYLKLRRSPELLREMDRVYVDGAAMVVALRAAGIVTRRRSMDLTSMAPEVLRRASRESRRVAVVGGRPGVAELALERLGKLIGPLQVVHVVDGYFANEAERGIEIRTIVSRRPDLVLVGMGTPLQEQFLVELRREGWRGQGFTCGGFLHQTASSRTGDYYPRAFRRARWLFRMIDEPRLIQRYLVGYPWFVLVFGWDIWRDRVIKP